MNGEFKAFLSPEEREQSDLDLGASHWMEIDQKRIDTFATALHAELTVDDVIDLDALISSRPEGSARLAAVAS